MAREQQTDALENEAPGVGIVKDKKLDALADKFTELTAERANVSEQITATESKILDRMAEVGIRVYSYGDRVVKIKDGKPHVKVRQVVKGDEKK